MDLPDQIAVLKSRGLIVEDDSFALHKLDYISYYQLANYWRPMEADKTTHKFKPGSRFEDIIRLYDFDMALRSLIFSSIQHVEIAFRSQIIHCFSLPYGAFWFMDPALFKNPSIYARCIHSLGDEINRTKEEFIVEHFAKYDNPAYPPVWKNLEPGLLYQTPVTIKTSQCVDYRKHRFTFKTLSAIVLPPIPS